jgi:hypothetical protein
LIWLNLRQEDVREDREISGIFWNVTDMHNIARGNVNNLAIRDICTVFSTGVTD